MLFVTRKNGQEVIINPNSPNEIIVRIICNAHPDIDVTVGICAPEHVTILREELTRGLSPRRMRRSRTPHS